MRRVLLSVTVLALATVAAADTPPSPSPSPRPVSGHTRDKATPPKAQPKVAVSPAPSPVAPTAATKGGPEKKVYTNQDLPAEPSPAPVPSPGAGRGTVNVLPESANLPTLTREESEAGRMADYWRERGRQRRAAVENAEGTVRDLEARIAELRTDRGVTNVMDPNREQTRQAQIAQTQADLEQAKGELERARQAMTDLEDEARRKGIPPGWIREQ
jgi:hypothetical protein